MKNLAFLFLFLSTQSFAQSMDWTTPFEKDNNYSATYFEVIDFYEKLAKLHPWVQLQEVGETDSGYPLHLVVISKSKNFDPAKVKGNGKRVLFVNNAIHPGEPCGVDASMMLMRDLVKNKGNSQLLEDVVVVTVPFYNISGGLNRGSFSRANQDGPKEHGFRGNIQNLDLNRDFIKCDSKNAKSFNQIFTKWQPDVFIDNHTSNGADYQYTLTMIATQKDKLNPVLSEYMQTELLPHLYKEMKVKKWEMTPYVFVRNTPDEGIAGFLDLPRYSGGYAAVHNCLSFTSETHMLKPFKDRVWSTYTFMKVMIETMQKDAKRIGDLRKEAQDLDKKRTDFDLNWELDMEQKEMLLFKGYEAKYKPSEISGIDRLYYDRNAPFEKEVPFLNTYKNTLTISKPICYVIPQAYGEIIERLQWNGVEVKRLTEDLTAEMEMYYIRKYEDRAAYEGHYLHYNVEVEKKNQVQHYRKGDYVVFTNQATNQYILSTLEPQAPDSYFAWNFFDAILMQKEYFSSYVFEDLALEILKENPEIKTALEAKKKEDEAFAKSARAQLDFVYKRSVYYEKTHQLYPIGRVVTEVEITVE